MARIMLLSILIVLLSVAKSVPISCPNLEDLKPCTCTRVAYGLQVRCADFNSAIVLERVLKILGDYQVHTLLLHNVNIEEQLPSNLFKGLKIKEIRIGQSSLMFDAPAFAGLDSSLSVLNVEQQTVIQSDETFKIAKLTMLNVFDVQNNHLMNIKNTWLKDKLPNVRKVVLDYNEISSIQNRAFSSLTNLEFMSMADNRISEVRRSMFPYPATHLKRIDFSFNDLSSLPKDFFQKMPNLREVILSGNEFKTLPELTWTCVWDRLTQVLLYENLLECDEQMHWITEKKKPAEFKGLCTGPRDMHGRSVEELYDRR